MNKELFLADVQDEAAKVRFFHKIDMYGSFYLLWLIWGIPFMLNSLREDVVIVQFPYEMLLHGPIILNVTDRKLACNPHFQLFLGSSAYLTDDFMGSVLTKAKSDEFLEETGVKNTLQKIRNATVKTKIVLGIKIHEVCERDLPKNVVGSCYRYSEVYETCLKKTCFQGVYLCWWSSFNLITAVLVLHIVVIVPGIFVLILIMFDPPPAGFRWVSKPWLVGFSFCSSATLGFIYATLCFASVANYLEQPVFYETFPSQTDGYRYYYADGFILTILTACVNLFFGCCYFYVTCFAMPYPRHQARYLHRKGFFQNTLNHIQKEMGVPTSPQQSYGII